MNDVELIAQALLKNNSGTSESENVKVLFSGEAKYKEDITLSEKASNFKALIFIFEVKSTATSLKTIKSVTTPSKTLSFKVDIVGMENMYKTSRTINFINAHVDVKVSITKSVYEISRIKKITDDNVILDENVTDFYCISVIGLK